MAIVGELTARLIADTRQFSAQMEQVKATMMEVGTSADKLEVAQARAAITQDKLTQAQQRSADANAELIATQKKVAEGALQGEAASAAQAGALDKQAAAEKAMRDAALENVEAQKRLKDATSATTLTGSAGFQKLAKIGKTALLGIAGAAAGIGIASLKLAAPFQSSMTQLVTGAGEASKNIAQVSSGILKMGSEVGQTPQQLADGMFMIESAGFHGAAGLTVLKSAAEGAAVGGADMSTIANVLTSALNAYGMKASSANSITSELVETVASGKMHMQDLASSLSTVLPVAASAKVSLAQVNGAMATMTTMGMSARKAAMGLSAMITTIEAPTGMAVAEMNKLGMTTAQITNLQTHLGKNGLTGTLNTLVAAITSHMGKSGSVLFSAFDTSKTAAQDATTMIAAMPPKLAKLATAYKDGSITQKQWSTDTQGLTPALADQATQFASVMNKVNGFNDLLKAGGLPAQTFVSALKTMVGGSAGLRTALLLTGSHAATFATNVKNIAAAGDKGKGSVQGFGLVTKDAGFQLKSMEAWLEGMAIRIGDKLIPMLENAGHAVGKFFDRSKKPLESVAKLFEDMGKDIAKYLLPYIEELWRNFTKLADYLGKNRTAMIAVAGVITGVLGAAIGAFIVTKLQKLQSEVQASYKWLLKLIGVKGTPSIGPITKDAQTAGADLSAKMGTAGGTLITNAGKAGDALAAGAKEAAATLTGPTGAQKAAGELEAGGAGAAATLSGPEGGTKAGAELEAGAIAADATLTGPQGGMKLAAEEEAGALAASRTLNKLPTGEPTPTGEPEGEAPVPIWAQPKPTGGGVPAGDAADVATTDIAETAETAVKGGSFFALKNILPGGLSATLKAVAVPFVVAWGLQQLTKHLPGAAAGKAATPQWGKDLEKRFDKIPYAGTFLNAPLQAGSELGGWAGQMWGEKSVGDYHLKKQKNTYGGDTEAYAPQGVSKMGPNPGVLLRKEAAEAAAAIKKINTEAAPWYLNKQQGQAWKETQIKSVEKQYGTVRDDLNASVIAVKVAVQKQVAQNRTTARDSATGTGPVHEHEYATPKQVAEFEKIQKEEATAAKLAAQRNIKGLHVPTGGGRGDALMPSVNPSNLIDAAHKQVAAAQKQKDAATALQIAATRQDAHKGGNISPTAIAAALKPDHIVININVDARNSKNAQDAANKIAEAVRTATLRATRSRGNDLGNWAGTNQGQTR